MLSRSFGRDKEVERGESHLPASVRCPRLPRPHDRGRTHSFKRPGLRQNTLVPQDRILVIGSRGETIIVLRNRSISSTVVVRWTSNSRHFSFLSCTASQLPHQPPSWRPFNSRHLLLYGQSYQIPSSPNGDSAPEGTLPVNMGLSLCPLHPTMFPIWSWHPRFVDVVATSLTIPAQGCHHIDRQIKALDLSRSGVVPYRLRHCATAITLEEGPTEANQPASEGVETRAGGVAAWQRGLACASQASSTRQYLEDILQL